MKKPSKFFKVFLPLVMLLIFIMTIAGCSTPDKPDTTVPSTTAKPSFQMPATGLASALPVPESTSGDVKANDSNVLKLELYDITPLQYYTYMAQCKAVGFFDIVLKYDTTIILANAAGNSLALQYSEETGTLQITLYAPGVLTDLTYAKFIKTNASGAYITDDLVLPAELKIETENGNETLALTWTSSNPEILSVDGVVNRPEGKDVEVVLTATASNGMVKEYPVRVLDKTGATAKGRRITLNSSHASVVLDLGASQKINHAVLTDSDNTAMLTTKMLTLWVSDDGENYTQIKNYRLLHIGPEWYLYGFEVEGRYIKAEYTMHDSYYMDFKCVEGKMLLAGYEEVLGSNGAPYTESTYALTNKTGKTQLDEAWCVSKAELGITGSDASIRILLDGKTLYHYVDGDNVIFRIDNFEKDASVTLTVQQSDSIAPVDYSNKEGVYEVTYGTVYMRKVTQNNTTNARGSVFVKEGTVWPDGSVQEYDVFLAHYTSQSFAESTDGGKTWTVISNFFNDTPEGGTPVTNFGGSACTTFDPVTHRIILTTETLLDPIDFGGSVPLRNDEIQFIYSDDGGKTWSQAGHLPSDPYENIYNLYNLKYNGGVMAASYDGEDGDGIDFVMIFGGYMVTEDGNFGNCQAHMAYTRDCGLTWQWSDTPVVYMPEGGSDYTSVETAMSECHLSRREDGVLIVIGRAQFPEMYNYAISYSIDNGVTWRTDAELSSVYATNTMPVINRMELAGVEDVTVMAWPGTNMMGGTSYFRTPLDFAVSTNGGETFRGTQNAFFGTTMNDHEVYRNGWGDDKSRYNLIMNHYSTKSGENAYYARLDVALDDSWLCMTIDEFDDWFTRTKGVFDSFESGTAIEEGWVRLSGSYSRTGELASDGNYATKVVRKPSMTRSVPYLQDGTFSVDIYVTEETDLSWEFQAALSKKADMAAAITMRIKDMQVTFDGTEESAPLTEGWNTLTLDLKLTECKASFRLADGKSIDVPVNEESGNYVTFLTFFGNSEFYFDNLLVQYDQELVLKAEDGDLEAAEAVIEKIKAIGEVDATKKAAVEAARSAYNKLTQVQKDFVDRKTVTDWNADVNDPGTLINYYDVLKAAESWLAENA